MAQRIPIFLEASATFNQLIELDGALYTIRIQWNVRNNTAYLSISEENEFAGKVTSIKIVPNWPLLRQIKGGLTMTGDLIVIKEDAALGNEIEYTTLGNGYNMYYVTSDELLVWEEFYGAW